jgi:hypothetical protein
LHWDGGGRRSHPGADDDCADAAVGASAAIGTDAANARDNAAIMAVGILISGLSVVCPTDKLHCRYRFREA